MTQQEIIDLLKKEKKPLTAREISKKLNKSISSITSNLLRLKKYNEIKAIQKLKRVKKAKIWLNEYFI